ncbi:uncharacterized protein PV09_08354 [Verruconis gallopava]|uniref:Protein kinase domain-containing protein n=1 Tax=Verruconis gallopava TaxID=253628 RepID=A0A0D2ALP2_9PEZI|nr:uncharacterized protein PV09_08354 [Verruconis gallopava]KIV99998.1 hypothetical protein PV09_08354 [Verruconis gallopava]
MAASLRSQMLALRRPIANTSLKFIPHRSLFATLTLDKILAALSSAGLSPVQIPSLADRVLANGRKVFAVLILLKNEEAQIVQFVKHDQLALTSLDSRLPFTLPELESIVPEIASEFFEWQWEVCAPVFTKGILHRELHDAIRIPFVSEEKIGYGGFGDVYCVELDRDQQILDLTEPDDKLRVVRKEFKSTTEGEDDWAKELQNLSLLSELKHPNMVEFLCSYTHRRKHNLLFRLVKHGTMSSLFEMPRPAGFSSDEIILHSLAQLASAICLVHSFTIKRLNLKFIGCHHDLKPKNILFSGQAFILSDFGLSRFRDAAESSKEVFEVGQGHYLAPECEDAENAFQKGLISRPSDIWSFGCIIAEVLTYLCYGPGSVAKFRFARRVKIGVLTTSTFHAGSGKENAGLMTWLKSLEAQEEEIYGKGVSLVRKMLSLEPERRPKIAEVTFELGRIALVAYCKAVEEMFQKLCNATHSIEADMEQRRFRIWRHTFESMLLEETCPYRELDDPMQKLDPLLYCLSKCKNEASSILEHYETALQPLYSPLRVIIDQLHSFLPDSLSRLAASKLESELVQTADIEAVSGMSEEYAANPVAERIRMLLTIKRMSILAFQRESCIRPDLFIKDASQVKVDATKVLGEHSLAELAQVDGSHRRVLVEWISYSPIWEGHVSEEMMARVESITTLLNDPVKPIEQVLHSSGYFHQPHRTAFGVVYELPPSDVALVPRTLATVIQSTMDARHRPPLEDRFTLARQLVKGIIDCHKVGWMHKSISAHNIAFFHHPAAPSATWIRGAHIIGFNHSRPDDPTAFTVGPGTSQFKVYHHPAYASGARFELAFDYYSLGLVLLEIGLWMPLQKIVDGWKFDSLWKLKDMLLLRRVPLLVHAMGKEYHDLVEICLKGHATQHNSSHGEPESTALLTRLGRLPFADTYSVP